MSLVSCYCVIVVVDFGLRQSVILLCSSPFPDLLGQRVAVAFALMARAGIGLADGRPACPESAWHWLGVDGEGYAVRFGRDRKISADGFYSVTKSGPFTVYVFEHAIPPAGPSAEDQRLLAAEPARHAICFDTRDILEGEIFIYGDEVDSQRGAEPGLLFLVGRGYSCLIGSGNGEARQGI